MSRIAFTGPVSVYSLIAPVAESPTMPPLALTVSPATGLMLDDVGRGASAGKIVRKPLIDVGTVRL